MARFEAKLQLRSVASGSGLQVQGENIEEQLSLLPHSPLATDAHAIHDVVFIEYRRVDHAGTEGSTARRCERRRIQDWAGHAQSLAESKALLLS